MSRQRSIGNLFHCDRRGERGERVILADKLAQPREWTSNDSPSRLPPDRGAESWIQNGHERNMSSLDVDVSNRLPVETAQVTQMTSAMEPMATAIPLRAPVAQPLSVGIDYGTSSSAVARLDADGVPRLLPDRHGRELTDSILTFGNGGEVSVGEEKEPRESVGPLVRAIKRHLGERDFSLEHDGQVLNPELLSALILRKLSRDASRFGSLESVILTVPSYFFAPGRRAVWNTARLAGLPVVELIAEPVAAALAHLWRTEGVARNPAGRDASREPDRERTLLVFDLGGGTFDVTMVRARGGRLIVAATEGDNRLGGIDWTERLVNFAAEKFKRRNGSDPRSDPRSSRLLFANCEAAKCRLSRDPRVVIDITHDGITMPLGLSREEFGQITADLLARARDAAEFLFESSAIVPEELDEVLLVGGGSQLPCIVQMMTEVCGRPVIAPHDPQRCVVEGAAIYAAALAARRGMRFENALLRKRLESIQLGDVNAHSIGIALDDPKGERSSVNHILIPRNTTLPASVKARFVTSLSNPEGIALRLVEGEAPEVSACTTIGHWRILGLPADLPAGASVELAIRCSPQREVSVEVRGAVGQANVRVERLRSGRDAFAGNQELLASFRLV